MSAYHLQLVTCDGQDIIDENYLSLAIGKRDAFRFVVHTSHGVKQVVVSVDVRKYPS